MRQDVQEAIDAASGVALKEGHYSETAKKRARRESTTRTKFVSALRAMLQELPDDMTVSELRDEVQGDLMHG